MPDRQGPPRYLVHTDVLVDYLPGLDEAAAWLQTAGCVLVTLNRKHFPMLPDVLVPYARE